MGIFGEPNIEKMKAKRDVKGLIKALKYKKQWGVRWNAAKALVAIGDARAVGPLIQATKDQHSFVSSAATDALWEMGEPAVEPLIQALKDKEGWVRRKAAFALGEIKDAKAVGPLIQALEDKDADVRRWAAWALETIGNARAAEPLIRALKDENRDVRRAAVQALSKIGDARAVEPLIQALQERGDLRWEVMTALAEIRDARAVEPLIQALLEDKDANVRHRAVWALREIRDKRTIKPMTQVIKNSSDSDKVESAVSVLEGVDKKAFGRAIDILFQNARGENWEMRCTALMVLKANMDELFKTRSAKEVVTDAISICSRWKEQRGKYITEIIPKILPYLMVADDPYEEIFTKADSRSIDEETAREILEGILRFLQLASKNLSNKKLKEEAREALEGICWQDGICPVGDVDLGSEAIARRVLTALPIISKEDPRRNTNYATSTYYDIDRHNLRTYNLNKAAQGIYSYWTHEAPGETYKRCRVEKYMGGRQLEMAKDYREPDGSSGMFGFTVVRLDKNRFLFYGRDIP
jgi:HEAT repeat protein